MSELVETPEHAKTQHTGGKENAPDMMDISPVYGYSGYYDFINNHVSMYGNQVVLVILFIIIILYYFVFSSLPQEGPTQGVAGTQDGGMYTAEIILWILFIFLVLTNTLQFFFKLNITTAITDIFTDEPKIDIDIQKPKSEPVEEITYEKQVFHVPDNTYTYEDAKAVCKAYGSRLATYKEMEQAYNEGAEWCSYGWSSDQMVLFPTQEATWKKLQKHPHQKHACGRPGVNGGYIDNPNARFGINCYGYKPVMNNEEKQIMRDQPLVPETKEERAFDEKVKYYRKKLHDILVSPFNRTTWSRI